MSFHASAQEYSNRRNALTKSNSQANAALSLSQENRSRLKLHTLGNSLPTEKLPDPASAPLTEAAAEMKVKTPIADPIYMTLDSNGIVLAVDALGATRMGYEVKALVHQPVQTLIHPSDHDRLRGCLSHLSASGIADPGIFQLVCPDGGLLPCNIAFQSLNAATKAIFLLVCTPLQAPELLTPSEHLQSRQILKQQAEWEKLLRAISQAAPQPMGLRLILQTIAAEVQQSLNADRVLIYRTHPRKTGSIMVEALAKDCPSVFQQTRVAALFQRQYMQRRFADRKSVPEAYQTTHGVEWSQDTSLQRLGVRSEAVVPIFQQGKLWGLLIVHQCRQSRLWQPWEMGLVKQVGSYLDSVIQQAELYQKVQRLNANLERQIQARTAELRLASEFEATLKRITDKVRDSLDERQILETAVRELVNAIGISGCNASIYDLKAGTSTISYEYTTNLSPYQGRVVHLDASPGIYAQLLHGQTFQFCSLMINPTRGKVAMLTCPIVDDQDVLGDLWLINQPYYCFSEQDIRLVRQVANHCAIAIRQARLYQAAQAQVEELERLNHLKDDFLSTVSHELRTPMANIKMATQMLEVTLSQNGLLNQATSKVGNYFQILQAECQREIHLINDLLDLSRLDSEQTVPHRVPVDLNAWLPSILSPFLERANHQQQQLQLDLPASIPPLAIDLTSLERILAELLQNACKYTPSGETISVSAEYFEYQGSGVRGQEAVPRGQVGGITIAASRPHSLTHSLAHSLTPSSPTLRLYIINSGVEIPSHELNRIFEKFYRIPSSDRWQHGGTGLGLALVRKLAEHLGGTVWAESQAGQTCFTVELPVELSV
ncbi:GAF domain-containing protein [Egbenema bharatensis]|uniref:GAF domain-containing protein n=1 Tax=Egbenema bharatensis TaxID=3463334 RepID=UPI003A85DC08